MDTGVRLQRFVVQEMGEAAGVKLGKGTATILALLVAVGLTFGAGADGSGGMLIWPLFGTTNQLMAGLTLSVVAVMVLRRGRSALALIVPLILLGEYWKVARYELKWQIIRAKSTTQLIPLIKIFHMYINYHVVINLIFHITSFFLCFSFTFFLNVLFFFFLSFSVFLLFLLLLYFSYYSLFFFFSIVLLLFSSSSSSYLLFLFVSFFCFSLFY